MEMPFLNYADLIDAALRRPLSPSKIPIHPSVYASSFAYTRDFVDEVRVAMPRHLAQNALALKEILGIDEAVDFDGESIVLPDRHHGIRVEHLVDPDRKKLEIGSYDSIICISPKNPKRIEILLESPLASQTTLLPATLNSYAYHEDEKSILMHSWYVHNATAKGSEFFHYLRTFAVAFNNMGIERLMRQSQYSSGYSGATQVAFSAKG